MEETLGVWLELAQGLASRAEELTGLHRAMGMLKVGSLLGLTLSVGGRGPPWPQVAWAPRYLQVLAPDFWPLTPEP